MSNQLTFDVYRTDTVLFARKHFTRWSYFTVCDSKASCEPDPFIVLFVSTSHFYALKLCAHWCCLWIIINEFRARPRGRFCAPSVTMGAVAIITAAIFRDSGVVSSVSVCRVVRSWKNKNKYGLKKSSLFPHINSADENCAILVMEILITIIIAILKIQTVHFVTSHGRTIGLMAGWGVNDQRRWQ